MSQFGFLELDRGGDGEWRGTVLTPDPAAWAPYLAACDGSLPVRPFLCVEGLD